MESLTANEAKTHFGDMLMQAQRHPLQIKKNGKPVAVVMSVNEYESIESIKLELLRARLERAETDIEKGNLVNGDNFINELISGQHD